MDPRERLNDPEEAQRAALDGRQARIRTAHPGIVVSADLDAQTLSVQMAIQGAIDGPDGNTTNANMPLLVDVPICWPRAGGFALTFPVAPGDEVLVVFGDRCIDSWWQSGGVGAPLEPRMHDLSDAFAILAPTSQPKRLTGVSGTAMQLRNEAGTAYIEITAVGDINTVGRNVTQTATGTMLFTAAGIGYVSTGGVPVTWSAAAIALTGASLTHNGINVGSTHTHGGVQTGSGNTGGPV